MLAVATSSRVVVLDVMRLVPLAGLEGHPGGVNQLLWTGGSKFLVSACFTGQVYVWRN